MSAEREELASWRAAPSPWPDLPARFVGVDAPAMSDTAATDVNDLVYVLFTSDRGRSFLAWQDYQAAAELHRRLVESNPNAHDTLLVDGFADLAARIAQSKAIPQAKAEQLVRHGLALRDRIPDTADLLRTGHLTPDNARTIITRTDLVDGLDCVADIDREIADEILAHRGCWSTDRLRYMTDRIVHRHCPEAVRESRKRAVAARRFWTKSQGDGMAMVGVSMTSENAELSAATVEALAGLACPQDPRTRAQRTADAAYARLTGHPFECLCGRDDCSAEIPEPGAVVMLDSTLVVHVIVDESTLDGTAEHAGFIAGHGVVGPEHVRDLARRPDAIIRPLVPTGTPMNPDGTYTLPSHLPSNPYRPSTALDTYVRIRDGLSVIPGSAVSSFDADLDHVKEFDHYFPHLGGQTTPENLNAKDRLGHLLKTFGEWLDDQYHDGNGRLTTEFVTPEGLVIPGPPENLETLFPGLRRIRFKAPPKDDDVPDAVPPAPDTEPPTRRTSRVADKHARRRQERERNRRHRERG